MTLVTDTLKILVAVFLLVVLQVSAMPQLMPTEATPDLVAVLVVMLAIRRGMEAAALAGFMGGVLLDALSYQHLGLTSLLYVLVGVLIAARLQPARGHRPATLPAAGAVARPSVRLGDRRHGRRAGRHGDHARPGRRRRSASGTSSPRSSSPPCSRRR